MEECRQVLKVGESALFDEEKISEIFNKTNALANPIRIKILKLLLENGELCVCEIENALGLKQSKVSYHLASLIGGDFINRRQSGPWSYYTINDNASDILKLFSIE
jgi:ArsR family transcriptional regulator